jgi:predicted kinase
MVKHSLAHPTLVLLYGYPGSGKTYFGRQLSEELGAAHVQGDRIRFELFDDPRYDAQENQIVSQLMIYMSEEFLRAGISVVFDVNAARLSERRVLRDMARKVRAQSIVIWLQIDLESAFARVSKRDRRKADDKYSYPLGRDQFDHIAGGMQNPSLTEDYIVISGKHTFHTQRSAVIKRLYDFGLLGTEEVSAKLAKPGLVNLVPNLRAGRVDSTRRNIIIR